MSKPTALTLILIAVVAIIFVVLTLDKDADTAMVESTAPVETQTHLETFEEDVVEPDETEWEYDDEFVEEETYEEWDTGEEVHPEPAPAPTAAP